MRWILISTLSVFATACGNNGSFNADAGADAQADASQNDAQFDTGLDAAPPELPSSAHPLVNGDSTSETTDLAAFLPTWVGQVSVLALGENVHTSGGQHRIRSRVLRYAVETLGFRAITLETPFFDALPAKDYVDRCTREGHSDARLTAAIRSIFGVFASQEMQADMRWMCAWNENHAADPVQFWGYDIQDPWSSAPVIRAFFADQTEAGNSIAKLDSCGQTDCGDVVACYRQQPRLLTAESNTACLAGIAELEAHLVRDQAELAASKGLEAVALARIALRSLRAIQGQNYYSAASEGGRVSGPEPDLFRSFESRDEGMADLLLLLRTQFAPGKRMVLTAHNTHIAFQHHLSPRTGFGWGGVRTLGTYLRERIGADYRAVAITALQTSINWQERKTYEPLVAESVEVRVNSLGLPAVFLDLLEASAIEVLPSEVQAMGPQTDYQGTIYGDTMNPYLHFDALISMKESEAMVYSPLLGP